MIPHSIKIVLLCLALFLGTLLLFSRALHNEFLDLDDPDYVTHNTHVQAGLTWTTLRWALTAGDASNWHPLTWLSHAFDCQLFGANPVGHHATSIVIHSLNAVLVFLVLRQLTANWSVGHQARRESSVAVEHAGAETGSPARSQSCSWLCAFSAALFAWHPLRVESVAWISERKDVLSVFFGLLTLWSYVVYAGKSKPGARMLREPAGKDACVTAVAQASLPASSGGILPPVPNSAAGPKRFYLLALVAFTAGLLCKPMLVTLPFLLLLLDYWPLQRLAIGRQPSATNRWQLLAEKIPFLVFATASCVTTYLVQSNGGAVVENLPLSARFANAVVSLVRYLGKFFWPFDLAIGYPTPERWPPATVIGAALLLLTISALAVRQRERRPWLLVGWLWFLGMLVPVIGVVQVGLQAMADRYTYLPMLGIQIALLGALREFYLCGADGNNSKEWNDASPCLAPLHKPERLLSPSLSSIRNGGEGGRRPGEEALGSSGGYRANLISEQSLPGGAGQGEGGRPRIFFNLLTTAALLLLAGLAARTWDQLAVWRTPLTLHWHALAVTDRNYLAEAYLGTTLFNRERYAEAAEHFRRAIEYKPNFRNAHYRLGRTLESLNQPAAAVAAYESAIALNPAFSAARYSLGLLHLSQAQPTNAVAQFTAALQTLRATDTESLGLQVDLHVALGTALSGLGRPQDAVLQFERALTLDERNAVAQFNCANALSDLERYEEARGRYERAVQLDPDFVAAHNNYANCLRALQRPADARAAYQLALTLRPDDADAHYGLGAALEDLGHTDEALASYREAVRLRPDFAEAQYNVGVLLLNQNHPAAAIPHLEQALRLNSKFPGLAEALDRLRQNGGAVHQP